MKKLLPEETSASLLSGLRKSDQPEIYHSCWERFVDQYTPMIFQWARRAGLDHHDAEEITQQLMCRLVRSLRNFQYDEQRNFRNWLFTCTRNVIFQFWKDQAKVKTEPGFSLSRISQPPSLIEHLNFLFDREFEFEARKRIQKKVSQRDWEIFLALTESSQDANEVAEDHQLKIDNVYKIKSRMVSLLNSELESLKKTGIE